jgi:hypothetical protein
MHMHACIFIYPYKCIQVIVTLYKSLVRPHLEYANSVWSPLLERDSDALEAIQRRATRLVGAVSHLSYHERMRELKLPTLKHRRRRGDMLMMYRLMVGDSRALGELLFQRSATGLRGHPHKVFKPRAHTRVRANFFTCRVVKDWNDLPSSAACARNTDALKVALDKHFDDKDTDIYFYKAGWG